MDMDLRIQDFCDMQEFNENMSSWAMATGLATVAVGADGEYISDCFNFTDFCIKYTRGSAEGKRRCEECDRTGKGVYACHAGLVDFAEDLVIDGQKVGAVIGGQVLPENPDEEKFRRTAAELKINPDEYIDALHKVNVRTKEAIDASARLLGMTLNNYINACYYQNGTKKTMATLNEGIEKTNGLVQAITDCTASLQNLQKRQRIVAINASIEAARVGEAGKGFAVVADEVEKLSQKSSETNRNIEDIVNQIRETVSALTVHGGSSLQEGEGDLEEPSAPAPEAKD